MTQQQQCEAKVAELVDSLARTLKAKAMQLYASGAVDVSEYEEGSYRLPKILVTAAIADSKDCYRLDDAAERKALANLRHF